MAILNQKRILNLIPKTSAPVTIHVSQGDVGTEIEFTLVKGDELFVNTGNLSASVHGVREDGANFGVFTCTLSGSSVKFPLHAEMTAVKGSAIAEIVLVDSQGNKVGSSNFGIMVEESVFPLGVTYDNDVSVYESILAYVQTIPAQVEADFNTAIAQEANTRSSQIQTLTNNLSAETTARQNADSTLQGNIDSEASTRASADASLREAIDALVSPSGQSVVVDNSLSISGAAADAKVVGDNTTKLKNATSRILTMEQGSINVNGIEGDSSVRIRTADFIYGASKIELVESGFLVYGISYYDPYTKKFVQGEFADSASYTLTHPELLARITIRRSNASLDISPSDVTVIEYINQPISNESLLTLIKDNKRSRIIPFEQGTYSGITPVTRQDRIRSTIMLPGVCTISTGQQYTHVFAIQAFDKEGNYHADLFYQPLSNYVEVNLPGYYIRVIVAARTQNDGSYNVNITPESVNVIVYADFEQYELLNTNYNTFADVYSKLSTINSLDYNIPTEKFEPDYNLKTISEIELDFSTCVRTASADVRLDNQPETTYLTQIYALFDQLVEDYPDYGKKSDPALTYGMEYPEYANGVSGSSTYLDTSAYKTYMYTFKNPLPAIGTTTNNPLQKIFLFGGTHGNEYFAPYNLYQFSKELCESYLTDLNLFKLRASFEISILPVLNGYGALHRQRGNANNININRNFSCEGWVAGTGADTKYNSGLCDYHGEIADSEFETQLIRNIVINTKPVIVVDHHNYSAGQRRQFYTIFPRDGLLRFSYQATTEIAYVFKKNYPQYFGTNFGVLQEEMANSPAYKAPTNGGYTCNFCDQYAKVPICGIVEVSNCINYDNGVADGTQAIDRNGTITASIAEYTLRNQLLRFCQWILDHAAEVSNYWNKDVLLP